MKKHVILLAAAAFIMVAIIPNAAKAQDPFKNLTKDDVVCTFKVPDIVDFVTTFLSNTEDELNGGVAAEWTKYLKNEKQGKGVTFTVDKKNGYVRYEMDYDVAYPEDKSGDKTCVEYCYWNCADGLHKLFAENVVMTQKGKPIFTEFSGMYIYVYDNATQKLYWIDQSLLGLGEETHGEITFSLPRTGKDIEVFFGDGTQKTLAWNGKGFTLKDK